MKSSRTNIALDHIEYEIPEKDLNAFKSAIAQGCIKRVSQLSTTKWYYLVKWEENVIEIEVTYNQKSIKQFHCGCGAHSPGKFCRHVLLVSYWHVSSILSKSEFNNEHSNSNLKNLSNSSEEDLRYYISFLGSQNKMNREWILFFESARSNSTNPFQKYTQLITEFQRFLDSQIRNTASRFKIKLQLFEELYYISFYHYKKSNIQESIHALLAGIDSLQNWHYSLEWKYQSRLTQINDKMHSALTQFISSLVAPRTLGKISQLISEIACKKEYLILSSGSNLFQILENQFPKDLLSKNYFGSLVGKLDMMIRDEYKFNGLDYLSSTYPEKLIHFLKSGDSDHLYYSILSWADARKKSIHSDFLLEIFPLVYNLSNKELKSVVALKFAELIERTGNYEKANALIKYYLDVGNPALLEIYFKYRSLTQEDFTSFLDNLENYSSNELLTPLQKLDFAYYSKQVGILFLLLKEYENLDWLVKYDNIIPEKFHTELMELYIQNIRKYLLAHVGQKSHQKLEYVMRHIKSVYKPKYLTAFLNELKMHFPGRKHLNHL